MNIPRYDGTVASVRAFLEVLDRGGIHYELGNVRPEALMVTAAVPGQRWEIEFLAAGTVEVEIFASDGETLGETDLGDLVQRFAE
jgi:hypothetical protein